MIYKLNMDLCFDKYFGVFSVCWVAVGGLVVGKFIWVFFEKDCISPLLQRSGTTFAVRI